MQNQYFATWPRPDILAFFVICNTYCIYVYKIIYNNFRFCSQDEEIKQGISYQMSADPRDIPQYAGLTCVE